MEGRTTRAVLYLLAAREPDTIVAGITRGRLSVREGLNLSGCAPFPVLIALITMLIV
jgi:hypothetical protein